MNSEHHPQPSRNIEHIFRKESGRLISVLTRIFGPHNLELAEDVVQESFLAAVDHWSAHGMPDNPAGWLLTTARNRAIDTIRKERTRRRFADDLSTHLSSEWTLSHTVQTAFGEADIRDDQLRMIFMCCHKSLSIESRLTLILKTLCGFRAPAVASALLTSEATINKRLFRIRKALRGVRFAAPDEQGRDDALQTVHTVLYLMFNEGFFSTNDQPIRRNLCVESMNLAQLMIEEPRYSNAQTVALLALMSLTAARMDARLDEAGKLIPLDRQDRNRWDRNLIRRGFELLARSSQMELEHASRFHLEAAIASRHCQATTFEQTDWNSICKLYDRLNEINPSPMQALNRAVAISYRDGADAALELVEQLYRAKALPHSHAVVAVLANLHARTGSDEPAQQFLREALQRAPTAHDRELFLSQMERAKQA